MANDANSEATRSVTRKYKVQMKEKASYLFECGRSSSIIQSMRPIGIKLTPTISYIFPYIRAIYRISLENMQRAIYANLRQYPIIRTL